MADKRTLRDILGPSNPAPPGVGGVEAARDPDRLKYRAAVRGEMPPDGFRGGEYQQGSRDLIARREREPQYLEAQRLIDQLLRGASLTQLRAWTDELIDAPPSQRQDYLLRGGRMEDALPGKLEGQQKRGYIPLRLPTFEEERKEGTR